MPVDELLLTEKLKVYASLIQRFRWLATSCILLSTFGLIHLLNENYSYTSKQLQDIGSYRIHGAIEESMATNLNEVRSWLNEYPKNSTDVLKHRNWICLIPIKHDIPRISNLDDSREFFNKIVSLYTTTSYSVLYTDNTLQELKHGKVEIPLIGYSVYGNDFLLILMFLLVFFILGVYVSIKAVFLIVNELDFTESPRLNELYKLHFTFLGMNRTNGLMSLTETLFYIFPVIATGLAFWMDCQESGMIEAIFNPKPLNKSKEWYISGHGGSLSALRFRFIFMALCTVTMTVLTTKIIGTARDVNKLILFGK